MTLSEARKVAKLTKGMVWFKKHKGTWGVLDKEYRHSFMYSNKARERKLSKMYSKENAN